jgi:anti-sigma factor (TIGR02949 family)
VNRLTCEETFRKLDDYLDRELAAEEMELVRQHLETCAGCTQEFGFEASVLREVRAKIQRIDAPAGLLARITGLIAREREGDHPAA